MEEGLRLCVETIQQVRAIPGVAGVHIMAFVKEEDVVPELLERAGIGRRQLAPSPAGGGLG